MIILHRLKNPKLWSGTRFEVVILRFALVISENLIHNFKHLTALDLVAECMQQKYVTNNSKNILFNLNLLQTMCDFLNFVVGFVAECCNVKNSSYLLAYTLKGESSWAEIPLWWRMRELDSIKETTDVWIIQAFLLKSR